MIDETEKELLVAAYEGKSSSYQVVYSVGFDSPAVEKRYSEAINDLQAKDLMDVQHVYSSNTTARPQQSICCLTRQGVSYVEENNLVADSVASEHQKARLLIQEMEDAEKVGDTSRKTNLNTSFQQLSPAIQADAKQYQHLK